MAGGQRDGLRLAPEVSAERDRLPQGRLRPSAAESERGHHPLSAVDFPRDTATRRLPLVLTIKIKVSLLSISLFIVKMESKAAALL